MLGIKLDGQVLAVMGDPNESPFTAHWQEFYERFYVKKTTPPKHACTVLGTESGLRIYLHEIIVGKDKWPITICVNESGTRTWLIRYNRHCIVGLADELAAAESGHTVDQIRWNDLRAPMDEFIKNL